MKRQSFNGFDLLAPGYDFLARLVFGKSIRDVQLCFLDIIPSQSRVLILGGGTGWLLEAVLKRRPGCKVWYIETSKKMISMARKKNGDPNIHFIHGTIDEMPRVGFNVVITNFYLDLFPEATLQKIIPDVLSASAPSIVWMAADFVDRGRWWQRALLRMMYWFFGIVCRIEGKRLSEWQEALAQSGLQKIRSKDFFRGFMESSVWSVHAQGPAH